MKQTETLEWIARMERFKGTFSLALQTEDLTVQKKIHSEVEELRIAQEREREEQQRAWESKAANPNVDAIDY